SARECGEVRFSVVQLWSCFDRYLLKLSCALTTQAATVSLHFDASRCDARTAGVYLRQFRALLNSALCESQALLPELELLAEPDRERLLSVSAAPLTLRTLAQAALADSLDATTATASELCIHHLFSAQARLRPDAVALVCGGRSLRYREL